MADFKIGLVTHHYDKIGVCVIQLSSALAIGDHIRFVRGGEEMFEQEVTSIQLEHKKVEVAKKGDVVGLKVEREVKEGSEVYIEIPS